MNRDPYAIALNNAMTEIKKAYPDVQTSFIFTKEGTILTEDQETDQNTMNNVLESFENLKEKIKAIGKLESFYIIAKNGKITLSKIKDMYMLLITNKNADKNLIQSITNIIIPTILKTLETLTSTQPQLTPSKKLIVDTLTGFFTGDSVQIDAEILNAWTKNNDPFAHVRGVLTGEQITPEEIEQVKIETSDGTSTLCKVKEVSDQKMKGKNMIRIPEKICKSLEIKKGDLVKVEPAV
jgi:predicted regulator of Ras-like GTPase activity (Roadblock/LC7/MglB family)/translation initiation factor IF-1